MRTAEIKIHFPSMMGYYHTDRLKITGLFTLEKVRDAVFGKFQSEIYKIWPDSLTLHATNANVVLKNGNEVICSDDKFSCIQFDVIEFDAYFNCDPFDPNLRTIDISKNPYEKALDNWYKEFA